ncbi:MAG: hypothetical protein ACRCWJ_06005 [Casimicrobium sp.]
MKRDIKFSVANDPSQTIEIFKQTLVEVGRARHPVYVHQKGVFAYVLLMYGDRPAIALKHLRHLTNRQSKLLCGTSILPINILRLHIALFMSSPTELHRGQMEATLRDFVDNHMNKPGHTGDEYTVALAELVCFRYGQPPLHGELWIGPLFPKMLQQNQTGTERWLLYLTGACIHLQHGHHTSAVRFYSEARHICESELPHLGTTVGQVLSLLGERLQTTNRHTG